MWQVPKVSRLIDTSFSYCSSIAAELGMAWGFVHTAQGCLADLKVNPADLCRHGGLDADWLAAFLIFSGCFDF